MISDKRLFIIYFPVILLTAQTVISLVYFFDSGFYEYLRFYIHFGFGTNLSFSIFLLIFTYSFRFCDVSRPAAIGEVILSISYLVTSEGLFSTMLQLLIGMVAIAVTFWKYIKKFPRCRFAMWVEYYKTFGRFFREVIGARSIKKGFKRWEMNNIKKYSQRYGHAHTETGL